MYFKKTGLMSRLIGGVLVLFGILATVYSVRALSSQRIYCELKYGETSSFDMNRKAELAERAYRLYPHNYYSSMLLAEESWQRRFEGVGAACSNRLLMAEHWCGIGISQNPYRRELLWLDANLLSLRSPLLAADAWERYASLCFWNAWNLAGLVELLAEAGRIEDALEVLVLIQTKPEYTWAAEAFERAWSQEIQPRVSQ